MKIMGLDYGSVTVGVAISDSMLLTAQPVEVIKRKSENKLRQTLARIQVLAEENDVGRIVLGYPKNMNNSEGERVERTKEFMEKLKARTSAVGRTAQHGFCHGCVKRRRSALRTSENVCG